MFGLAKDRTRTAAEEQSDLLTRVERFGTAHVVREPGQLAAQRLKRLGLVDYSVQDGIWLVTKATPKRSVFGGGGDAA